MLLLRSRTPIDAVLSSCEIATATATAGSTAQEIEVPSPLPFTVGGARLGPLCAHPGFVIFGRVFGLPRNNAQQAHAEAYLIPAEIGTSPAPDVSHSAFRRGHNVPLAGITCQRYLKFRPPFVPTRESRPNFKDLFLGRCCVKSFMSTGFDPQRGDIRSQKHHDHSNSRHN